MNKAGVILVVCTAWLLPACASMEETQDENNRLRAMADSLKAVDEECHARYITIVQRMAALETENMKLDDRNRLLTAKIAEMSNLPTVSVAQKKATDNSPTKPATTKQSKAASTGTLTGDAQQKTAGTGEAFPPRIMQAGAKGSGDKADTKQKNASGQLLSSDTSSASEGITEKGHGSKNRSASGSQSLASRQTAGKNKESLVSPKQAPEKTDKQPRSDRAASRRDSSGAGSGSISSQQQATLDDSRLPISSHTPDWYDRANRMHASEAFLTRYQTALSMFHDGRYAESMDLFTELSHAPDPNQMTDNCMYWIGECLTGLGRFQEAISWYSAVLQFPGSEKQDDALIMRGNACVKLNDVASARQDYERLLREFPKSEYASLARKKLERLP